MPFPCPPLTTCLKDSLYMWKKRRGLSFWYFFCQEEDFGYGLTGQSLVLHSLETPWKGNIWPRSSVAVSNPGFHPHTQINNKFYGKVTTPLHESKDLERVQRLILESPLGQEHLSQHSIKKAILSPRTALINFLVDQWYLGVDRCSVSGSQSPQKKWWWATSCGLSSVNKCTDILFISSFF